MAGNSDLSIDSLCEVRDRFAGASSLGELARCATEGAGELFGCEACDLFLERGGDLVHEASFRSVPDETERPAPRDAAARALDGRDPLLIEDATEDDRIEGGAGYRSLLSIPLGTRGAVLLADRTPGAFDEETLAVADVFAGVVTQAIDRLDEESSPAIPRDVAAEFLEIADVMMVALDADGTVTFVNRKAREVLGYEAGELPGRDWFETCVPDPERGEVRAVFERLVAGEVDPAERGENAVLTRDGEKRLVEWHNTVLADDDGDVTGTLSAGLDITDEREVRRRLDEEREKYRTLVKQFPNGLVALFDEDHRYRIVGGTGLEDLGISADDIEGRRLEEVFPPENVDVVEPLYDGVFEGESGTVDVTLQDRVFRVRTVPVHDDDGEVFAGMTISQDVTDQKAHEEELEAARKRYRTLLQAVPDPVFVADADTGEILEVNEAAQRLRGQPSEEIVGCNQVDLHPDDRSEAYRELFEDHAAERGRRQRRFADGTQIHAVTGDGQQVPIEISTGTVEIDGRRLICGIFRDVSEQRQYELALTKLNEATREFFAAEEPADICRLAVETVTDVLDRAGATIHLVDETEAVLRPVAGTPPPGAGEEMEDQPAFEPGESVAWRVFTEGETELFGDVRDEEDLHNPETPVRSEIIVPLGPHGVLVAGRTESDAFDDRAVDLLEILGATVEAALERTEREQALERRQRQFERQTRELEELEAINARIRNVARAVVDSETRQEIEQAVCSELVDIDSVAFAWIGGVDPVEEWLVPRTWAGDPQGYLQSISRSLRDESTAEPAVRAAQTRERVVVSNAAENLSREPWRDQAVRRGFTSVMSIPLVYQESFQGVLTVYATDRAAFTGTQQTVLSELGELVAQAEVAINRTHAIVSNRATELEFEIQDPTCFFLRFTQDTGCALELDEVVPQSDGSWLVFVRVSESEPDDLIEHARRAPDVESARQIGTDGEALVQLRFTQPFIVSRLADRGISVRNITADGSGCQVTVAVPPTVSIHRTADVVSSLYPGSKVIAKREQMQQPTPSTPDRQFLERLTPRQREVVSTAYRRGYFDDPRGASGEEIAEELDFSPSAFHRHVRAVEREIFETLFGDEAGTSARQPTDPGSEQSDD